MFFKRLRRKLRSKKSRLSPDQDTSNNLQPPTKSEDVPAKPEVTVPSTSVPPFRAGNSQFEGKAADGTYGKQSLPLNSTNPAAQPKPVVNPSIANTGTSSIKPTQRSSGSVTMEERIRYQRIVLGMTEAQIQRALPPGQYIVQSGGGIDDRPSGRGDLAYAYYAQ